MFTLTQKTTTAKSVTNVLKSVNSPSLFRTPDPNPSISLQILIPFLYVVQPGFRTVKQCLTSFSQGHTLNLNRLVTLNVTQWPIDEKSFNSTFDEIIPIIRLYEHHLQRFSQLIFERSDADAKEQNYGRGHRSNLSVIAWGGNGKTKRSSNDNIRLRQIPFVRGTKVDPFGNSSLLAVQTKWESVQFVEPESDILTRSLYDLYWSFQGPGL